MARPREFDETAVMKAVLEQFWKHGYSDTSVRQLSDATGVTIASFYNAFGDKDAIFLRALELYVREVAIPFKARLEENVAAPTALRRFFSDQIEAALRDPDRKGCFLVNTSMDVGPHDEAFQKFVVAQMVGLESAFRELVHRGQKEGTINPSQSPKDLARLLLNLAVSLRLLARIRPERPLLEGALRPVFALLTP